MSVFHSLPVTCKHAFDGEGSICPSCTAEREDAIEADPRLGGSKRYRDGSSDPLSLFEEDPDDGPLPGCEAVYREGQDEIGRRWFTKRQADERVKIAEQRLKESVGCRPMTRRKTRIALLCERDLAACQLALKYAAHDHALAVLELDDVNEAGDDHRHTHEKTVKGWSSRIDSAEARLSQLEEELRNFPAAPSP